MVNNREEEGVPRPADVVVAEGRPAASTAIILVINKSSWLSTIHHRHQPFVITATTMSRCQLSLIVVVATARLPQRLVAIAGGTLQSHDWSVPNMIWYNII